VVVPRKGQHWGEVQDENAGIEILLYCFNGFPGKVFQFNAAFKKLIAFFY